MLAGALVGEHRHEQALTRQDALAGAEQRIEHAGTLLAAAVPEDRLELDAVGHVHHRPGFGDRCLARIELDLDELHLVAVNGEVDVVGATAGEERRGRQAGDDGPVNEGGKHRHVLDWLPVAHART